MTKRTAIIASFVAASLVLAIGWPIAVSLNRRKTERNPAVPSASEKAVADDDFDEWRTRLKLRPHKEQRPVTERELDAIERDIGSKIPLEYRRFVARLGYTVCEEKLYFFIPDGFEGVQWFFGIGDSGNFDLRSEYFGLADWFQDARRKFLPIAECYSGAICICIDDSDYGAVYFYHFMNSKETRLAATFKGFLGQLKMSSEYPES